MFTFQPAYLQTSEWSLRYWFIRSMSKNHVNLYYSVHQKI